MSLVITRNSILWFPGLGEPLASKPGKHDQTWLGQGVGEEDQLLVCQPEPAGPALPTACSGLWGVGGEVSRLAQGWG